MKIKTMCLFAIITAVNSLECYVTNSTIVKNERFESRPLIKNCSHFDEFSKNETHDLRCFTVAIKTEQVNIVKQGCGGVGCGQIIQQVEWYLMLENNVKEINCLQCRGDGCNALHGSNMKEPYKKYAIIGILCALALTLTVGLLLRYICKSRKYKKLEI